MAESKSVKKNRKRRSGGKQASGETNVGFSIEEDLGLPTTVGVTSSAPSPPDVDPLTDLKRQLSEAKAAKDHIKAQELRHQLWVLQDTVHLGKAGPGAPAVDVISILTPPKPPKSTEPKIAVSPTTTDPTEKKLLKLRKKLEQIEALKTRQARGEALEKNQLTKIEAKSEIDEEIEILEELLRTNSIR